MVEFEFLTMNQSTNNLICSNMDIIIWSIMTLTEALVLHWTPALIVIPISSEIMTIPDDVPCTNIFGNI